MISMFLFGCIVGGFITWFIQESSFENRVNRYWKQPRGKDALSIQESEAIMNIGIGHLAALEWIQYPLNVLMPFEMLLFEWVSARNNVEAFKRLDEMAFKGLTYRMHLYVLIMEENSGLAHVYPKLKQAIRNNSSLMAAMLRFGEANSKKYISFEKAIQGLGGYQDFGEYIEKSDYPENIKSIILKTFFRIN